MTLVGSPPVSPTGVRRRLVSVPILFKILGVGATVAVWFGIILLLQIRGGLSRILHPMLEERALTSVRSMASALEHPVAVGDHLAVREALRRKQATHPHIRYIIVRDSSGRVLSHTFPQGVPPDLAQARPALPKHADGVTVLDSAEGLIFHVSSPILKGHGGTVDLGLSDREVVAAQTAITRSVLWALALAMVVGTGLAAFLAHRLVRPIRRLATAADVLGEGNYGVRAGVESGDEIGHLAEAFNRMAVRLEEYRKEVLEHEKEQRSLIHKIIHAQEEERGVISRELHDQLGQSLLALKLKIQQDGPPGATPYLEARVSGIIDEVRSLAWRMRPSILDDYGLDSALGRHVEDVAKQSGLHIDYQYTAAPAQGRMPDEVEITLYRVAQEALTNIQRHSRAKNASVVVLCEPEVATLVVEDDGCGFDVRAAGSNGRRRLGLSGMRERAALLGGRCAVESAPGKGTVIRVRVPLGARREPCPSES
ncbi:MAG: HAMP domain-containing protein [Planctomycetes bacterium]|nr:HAMP domain-containing protein [Planctomycetota bacterium]